MNRLLRGIALAVLMVVAAPLRSWSQNATAEVNGTVSDTTGAAVSGATVTLTNQDTKITIARQSSGSGAYIFVNVQPGNYTLKVTAPSFKSVDLAAFTLSVNQTFEQNVKLQAGGSNETVEVSATAAELLQKSSSELGTVIQEDVVQDMPLNGRNFTELLTLTPGATPVSTAQGSGVGTQDAGMSGIPGSNLVKPSLHGQQNRSTLYYLDGVTNTDLRGPVYGVLPMLDATSQFKVQAHNEKVEYGGVVGGIVNMVSRSGSNTLHGSAFMSARSDKFDARDKFKDVANSAPAPFSQYQFGGTLFFPIIKDRTFGAVAYEGWRYSQPTQTQAIVPTAAELSGDFSNSPGLPLNTLTQQPFTPDVVPYLWNPYTTAAGSKGKYTRTPFKCVGSASGAPVVPNADGSQTGGVACNKVPSQMFDPFMTKLLTTFLRAPNYGGPAGLNGKGYNYIEDRPRTDDNNEFQVKVDHRLSSRDNVWIRFTNMYVLDMTTVTGTIEQAPSDYHAYDWGVGYARTLTQHIVFDAEAGLLLKPYVFNTNYVPDAVKTLQGLGIADASQWGGLYASIGGPYSSLGNVGTAGDSIRKNPTWSASANLSFLVGKHNAKAGLQFTNIQRVQQNRYQQFSFSGTQTQDPSGQTYTTVNGTKVTSSVTGNPLASALLGFPNSYTGQLPTYSEDDFSMQMWSGYLQDEWRATPKLTAEFGVRYDYLNVPKILDGRISSEVDLRNGNYIVGAKQVPDCNVVQQNPCIPGNGFASISNNNHILFAGFNKSFLAPRASLFEPRIGLAYSLRDDMVIRAGYGLFFDALPARSQYAQNELEAATWPWATGFSGNADAAGSPLVPLSGVEGHFPSPVADATPWKTGSYLDSPNFKPQYSNQWNLELQQQFGKFTSLSIAYVGSSNGHVPYTGNANASPVAYPANTPRTTEDQTRLVPYMQSNMHWTDSVGRANYNALETRLMRQASRNLRMILSYTWGKSIDTSSGYFGVENGIGGGSAVQNYWDLRSNRSVSSYDIPHFVSLATLYNLPTGHGKEYFNHGVLASVLGDWQVNTLLQARSGQPYNLQVNGTDPANIEGSLNTLSGYERPDLVAGKNPIPTNPTTAEWFDPSAFSIPSGKFGDFPRNALRGSRVWFMDASLFKLVPIHDRYKVEFRAEGFNIFNIQSLAPPSLVTIGSTGAGGVTGIAGNPRQLQFGARFTF